MRRIRKLEQQVAAQEAQLESQRALLQALTQGLIGRGKLDPSVEAFITTPMTIVVDPSERQAGDT